MLNKILWTGRVILLQLKKRTITMQCAVSTLISVCLCVCVFMCVCPLHRELSRIRDHDAFVSQQAEHAHQQLAGALKQTHTNSESVPHSVQVAFSSSLLIQIIQQNDVIIMYIFICWVFYFKLNGSLIIASLLKTQINVCSERGKKNYFLNIFFWDGS